MISEGEELLANSDLQCPLLDFKINICLRWDAASLTPFNQQKKKKTEEEKLDEYKEMSLIKKESKKKRFLIISSKYFSF